MIIIGIALLFAVPLPGTYAARDDSDIINPNWVRPGYRAVQNRPTEECTCPPVPVCEGTVSPPRLSTDIIADVLSTDSVRNVDPESENNRLALVFYRKLVMKIFDESSLQQDVESSYKLRNIQFKIKDQQLLKLKEAKTARDIDAVVSAIVEQSEGSNYRSVTETLCWNFVAFYTSTLQSTTFLYIVLPAIVILGFVGVARWLHLSLWILVPLVALGITYVLTYRDCNNRLELEWLTKLRRQDGSNPCARRRSTGWLARLFEKDNEADCVEHLREQYGLKRNYCDPSEVLIEMVAKLQLQYFETFVEKMISIFKINTASSGFVESILICAFILMLIYLLMVYGIKYGIYGTANFFSAYLTSPWHRQQQPTLQDQGQQPPSVQGPPTAPVNININISRPRRTSSRVEIGTRVEEIQVKPSAPALALAPEPTSEKQHEKETFQDASPDSASETDEHGSSGEESFELQCSLPGVTAAGPPTVLETIGDSRNSGIASRDNDKTNSNQSAAQRVDQ